MICSAHGNSVAASAFGLVLVLSCIPGNGASAQPVAGKLEGTQLRFTGEIATAIFELAGGGLIDFRLNQTPNVNALNWDSSNQPGDVRPGHADTLSVWIDGGHRLMPRENVECPSTEKRAHVSWSVINPSQLQLQTAYAVRFTSRWFFDRSERLFRERRLGDPGD